MSKKKVSNTKKAIEYIKEAYGSDLSKNINDGKIYYKGKLASKNFSGMIYKKLFELEIPVKKATISYVLHKATTNVIRPNVKTPIEGLKEYDFWGEKPVVILWRKKGEKKTRNCPFCGKPHLHGAGEGHRIVHCTDFTKQVSGFVKTVRPRYEFEVLATDGTVLKAKDGYIIKHY